MLTYHLLGSLFAGIVIDCNIALYAIRSQSCFSVKNMIDYCGIMQEALKL